MYRKLDELPGFVKTSTAPVWLKKKLMAKAEIKEKYE